MWQQAVTLSCWKNRMTKEEKEGESFPGYPASI